MVYVEKEKVLEIAKDKYYSDFHKSMADLTSLRELLEDTPTADVEEVIRCKDCKYAKKSKTVLGIQDYECLKTDITCLDADDFCSYGERKDGE